LENPEDIVSQPIIVWVKEKSFKKQEEIKRESGCQSIGEVTRMIFPANRSAAFIRRCL